MIAADCGKLRFHLHVLQFHELHVNTVILKVTMYAKEINGCLPFRKLYLSKSVVIVKRQQ
jgi:hypothetical protein